MAIFLTLFFVDVAIGGQQAVQDFICKAQIGQLFVHPLTMTNNVHNHRTYLEMCAVSQTSATTLTYTWNEISLQHQLCINALLKIVPTKFWINSHWNKFALFCRAQLFAEMIKFLFLNWKGKDLMSSAEIYWEHWEAGQCIGAFFLFYCIKLTDKNTVKYPHKRFHCIYKLWNHLSMLQFISKPPKEQYHFTTV